MRIVPLAFVMSILAGGSMAAQDPPAAVRSDSVALLAIDSLWARNYVTNDTATAIQLMADDFFGTATNGAVKDRNAELADVRPIPGMKLKYFTTSQVRARTHGTTGVVTGVAEWSFEQNGNTSTIRRRYTAVYAKGGPLGWQLVALHMGRAE
jgi:hypothetical protein